MSSSPSPRRLPRLIALAVVALTALVAASGPARVQAAGVPLTQQLAKCKKQLADLENATKLSNELSERANVNHNLIFFVSKDGVPALVDVETYRDFLTVEFFAGKITHAQLVRLVAAIPRQIRTTEKQLAGLAFFTNNDRLDKDEECTNLAKKAKAGPPARGSLTQDGTVLTTPDSSSGLGYTWSPNAAAKRATITTKVGDATYTWEYPETITKDGTSGKITVKAEPGKAGSASNLATNIVVKGEFDFVCDGTAAAYCAAEAYTKGGTTVTKTVEFKVKARDYSPDRRDPVELVIELGPNGPGIRIPYVVEK